MFDTCVHRHWRKERKRLRAEYAPNAHRSKSHAEAYTSAPISWLVCRDGTTLSVQASKFAYCHPREFEPDGHYTAWEVHCVSVHEPAHWGTYWQEDDDGDPQPMGWVPTELIVAFVEKHGGWIGDPPRIRKPYRRAMEV